MSELKPLGGNIIVRRIPEEQRTATGILMPDKPVGHSQHGIIVAVGPKVRDVKPGDKVLISKWNASDVKVEGQDLIVLSEDNILGILNT